MRLAGFYLFLILAFLINTEIANAAIPILEFNITNEQTSGVFAGLPSRYSPIRSQISWYYNGTTYINMTRIVILPEGEFAYSSNNPENLIVDIDQEKGIVAVKPKEGWYGEETVIIYIDGIGKEQPRLVQSNNLIFSEINIEQLGQIFFDDALYNLFSSRFTSVIENSEGDSKVDVKGSLDAQNNNLILQVGKDVQIITGFYEQNGATKPKVNILIDAQFAEYDSKIGHCADNIRNYDETEVDCGGECLECVANKTDYTLIFASLIIIAGMIVVYMFTRRSNLSKHKRIVVKTEKPSFEDMRHSIADQIKLLRNNISDENMDKNLESLSRLIRSYFKNLFHIKYNFTYFELKNELVNRKVNAVMKEKMLKMFKKISNAEYGSYKLDKKELADLINEAVHIIDSFELRDSS